MVPCMATKTISLELDAYEKLRSAKRGERESFSEVVRRAVFPAPPHTGAAVLEVLDNSRQSEFPAGETFEYWDSAIAADDHVPRISSSHWEGSDAS